MPIQLPNLDDRTYDDLVQEAKSLIPTYAPDWTNHNPSDPGITLIELFAYVTEMLNYRLNRVTDANTEAFLKLINGPEWKRSPPKTLNEEIRQAVLTLRRPDRAVTCEDFESLVLQNSQVGRAKCVPERNLDSENRLHPETKPGHVSVVIVPKDPEYPKVFLFDGTFTDYTDKASLVSGAAFPLNNKPSDFLYVGLTIPELGIQFQLEDEGKDKGYNLKLEYFDGSKWSQVTTTDHKLVDETSNWTDSGSIQFESPKNWQQTAVNDVTDYYWLRISTTTVPSQIAKAYRITPQHIPVQQGLIDSIKNYLEPRRLLTTRVHVVGPIYVDIGVHLTLNLMPDALEKDVRPRALDALTKFLHPMAGGKEGKGWQFGRNVYVSEIYQLLNQLPGVDYVERIDNKDEFTVRNPQNAELVDGDTDRLPKNQDNRLIAVIVHPEELVALTKIELKFPTPNF